MPRILIIRDSRNRNHASHLLADLCENETSLRQHRAKRVKIMNHPVMAHVFHGDASHQQFARIGAMNAISPEPWRRNIFARSHKYTSAKDVP